MEGLFMKGIMMKAIVFTSKHRRKNRNGSMAFTTWIFIAGHKHGTCVMNAAINEEAEAVIWMLSNG